jgi:hypothetical protein
LWQPAIVSKCGWIRNRRWAIRSWRCT